MGLNFEPAACVIAIAIAAASHPVNLPVEQYVNIQ